MKLDQLCIPKIKIPRIVEKITLEHDKRHLLRDILPKLCSPLQSEAQRVCVLNWPRPGYIPKRGRGQFEQLKSKSFKTPTNMCQQNLIDFENKRNNKHLAIQIRKIDQMKRETIRDSSPFSKKLGINLLKISTDSLINRQISEQRRGKTFRDKEKGDNMSAKITDKLIKDLKKHYNGQKYEKDYNYLRKKYAELTFHQIIQSQSDEEQNPNRVKAARRKVKTQMSG